MTTPIKTKIHRILELIRLNRYSVTQRANEDEEHIRAIRSRIKPETVVSLLRMIDMSPKFYIDDELQDLLPARDIESSLGAMVQAGAPILPYETQVIEFDDGGRTKTGAKIRNVVLLMSSQNAGYPYVTFLVRLIYGGTVGDMVFFSPCRIFLDIRISTSEEEAGVPVGTPYVSCQMTPSPIIDGVAMSLEEREALANRDFKIDAEVSTMALGIASVLLNTRGIKKEVVSTGRINRKRGGSTGKPLIPEHTVIRIGHVYGRDGQVVSASGPSGSRKPTRVHWRRAHIRGIRYGKGREKIKYELIPACLVNYQDGDEVPVPRARVAL